MLLHSRQIKEIFNLKFKYLQHCWRERPARAQIVIQKVILISLPNSRFQYNNAYSIGISKMLWL